MAATGDKRRLSIITVTHNSCAVIGECLKCVRRILGSRAHAVVVDNASTDESLDVVATTASWTHCVALRQNEGFGRACNRAVSETSAEWLLFLNPDVRLTELRLPDSGHRPFGVGAGLARASPAADTRFLVWRESSPADDFLRETCMRFLPPRLARAWPRRESPPDWASAGLMLVRRDEFLQVGGFDERFFMYYEDRDLCRRFRRAGFPIRCDPRIAGIHSAGRSTDVERSTREAFSLAGWLEYTGIWRGQTVANTAAERALRVLAMLGGAVGRAPSWERGRTKAHDVAQIMHLLEHLDSRLPAGDKPVLPHARQALARARWHRRPEAIYLAG